uniref:Uncharacterized protein n=1 Tax=Glossina morsitans morsitans TaxID=37546 RepID=A0A1B0GDV9_GLOMM
MARRNLEKCSQEQRRHYNLRRRKCKRRIDKHPLWKATDQFAAKLASRYVGPYTMKHYVSPVIIIVKGDKTSRETYVSDLEAHEKL